MLRYGIILYPGDSAMFDWAIRRTRGYCWHYDAYEEGKGAPVVLFTTNKNERDVLAEEMAGKYPNTEFGCFVVDSMFMAPAAAAKRFDVSEKGVLPT